jgi:hypothetical protein
VSAGDALVEACLELALVYHCDPDVFLRRPMREIVELYRRTDRVMLRLRRTES